MGKQQDVLMQMTLLIVSTWKWCISSALEIGRESGRQDIIIWTESGQDISINVLYSYKKISEGLLVKDISRFECKLREWKTWSISALHKHDPGIVI